ncbi:translation initiation factor IF-2-like [Zalophus californianus]|uniref:Translation initiation factor IF-2-like n=1 Tax=Zalophus californianus TaxID=9704 RepID=A0A6J2DTP1_ZALCA|nr:translation initiation factor IF-2-like [Zalophus californianus]
MRPELEESEPAASARNPAGKARLERVGDAAVPARKAAGTAPWAQPRRGSGGTRGAPRGSSPARQRGARGVPPGTSERRAVPGCLPCRLLLRRPYLPATPPAPAAPISAAPRDFHRTPQSPQRGVLPAEPPAPQLAASGRSQRHRGDFQERRPGLLEPPTAGTVPDSQCIGRWRRELAGQAGEEEETGAQSEQSWAQHLPGPGSAWGARIDCVRGPAEGETHHITLDLPVHLDATRTSARTPRLCQGHVLCNCIQFLDRSHSILKLDFLSNK